MCVCVSVYAKIVVKFNLFVWYFKIEAERGEKEDQHQNWDILKVSMIKRSGGKSTDMLYLQ